MREIDPRLLIAVGFVLVVFGFVAPLLMVIDYIRPNFALSFFSHGASVAGLFLGILGGALYVRREGSYGRTGRPCRYQPLGRTGSAGPRG
jgi:hypothetical protein